jgi:type I restriction enzyme S subunit
VESRPGVEAQSSLTLFRKGDIVFGAMRPYFHKVCLAPFDGVTRTTAFVLAPIKPEMAMFALFQMFDDRTIEFATNHSEGSTIPYSKWAGSMENMGIVVPPDDVAAAFGEIVDGLMRRGLQNTEQSQILAELRDTLLPRLISGKLRIPEVLEQLEDTQA